MVEASLSSQQVVIKEADKLRYLTEVQKEEMQMRKHDKRNN
jgi:hypothetical protein